MTQTEALLRTIAIEVPIAVGVAALGRWAPGRLRVVAVASALASLVTHPLLAIVDPALAPSLPVAPRWALLESAVTLVEAAIYAFGARLAFRRGLVISIAANAASLAVGLASWARGAGVT